MFSVNNPTMDVGVGRSIMKKATRRLQIQETNKNKTMKASTISFPAASNNIERAAELECMDSLFNLDDSNNGERSNLEIMFANLMNHNKVPADVATAHVRAIVELMQLEVNVDISNIALHLEDTKMLQDRLGWKEKVLNDELKVARNDIAQYERYISSRCYDFKNDTWKYLLNLGTDELQKRQMKLQQMKSELKNQYEVLHQRMKLCHLLLWTLNNEEIKRQQRLHMLSFFSKEEMKLSHIIRDEIERLENTRSVFDLTLRRGMNHTEKNRSSILKEQKLGCTFDFVLHHRVNYGGSSNEYDNIVNIFEKKIPAFESVKNSVKTKKLLEDVFKKQMSRLERENEVYLLNKCPADSSSQEVGVDLSSSCLSKLPHVPNSSERDHTMLPTCLIEERDSSHGVQNQTEIDSTSKRQENERYLSSNSEQNGLKTTSCTKTEEFKKQTETECKKNLISYPNSEQDRAIETKQQELSSEQNKTERTSSINVKQKKNNNHNRYGLRSDPELHFDSEAEGIGHDVKPASESDVEQRIDTKTTKRNKDQDGSDGNKISIQRNRNEIRKLLEGNKPAKLVVNSSYESKTKSMKKLSGRMDSLEKLVQETNLELFNIKEGTEAFQRSMQEFKSLLRCHKDSAFGLEANACKSACESEHAQEREEEKISKLLESLKTLYAFLKRSQAYKRLIEERELSLTYMEGSLQIDEIEELVLRAANNIQELPLAELKQMQTKDLKLKDISKILTSVQNLMQFEEEGCFSDSSDSSIQIL